MDFFPVTPGESPVQDLLVRLSFGRIETQSAQQERRPRAGRCASPGKYPGHLHTLCTLDEISGILTSCIPGSLTRTDAIHNPGAREASDSAEFPADFAAGGRDRTLRMGRSAAKDAQHLCACLHSGAHDLRSVAVCPVDYRGHLFCRCRAAYVGTDSISSARRRRCQRAGTDLRQHPGGTGVDRGSHPHRRGAVSDHGAHHLRDPGCAEAEGRAGCHGHRTPVLVGISLSKAGLCDGQRAARAGGKGDDICICSRPMWITASGCRSWRARRI